MQYSKLKNNKRYRVIGWSLASALGALFMSTAACASLVVIGNKDIHLNQLNNTQLSDIYLGKSVSLPGGETLNPVDQDPNSKIYATFYQNVVGMDVDSVTSYWSGLVFSGTGQQPAQVENDHAAIAAVENNPETIAYIDSHSLGKQLVNVKVLAGRISASERAAAVPATHSQVKAVIPHVKATIPQAPQPIQTVVAGTDLWTVMRNHFTLSSKGHEAAVKKQLAWYCSHRWIVNMILKNSAPYLSYVYQQTQTRNMPAEFALLPMVESGYVPFAKSPAGASGLWQILPNTAMGTGIKMNWWYDGRLDTVEATNAALDYLTRLHEGLGSWPLAAAAYNAGEGAVIAAMDVNKRKGITTNYWSLPLANQTRHYVPKLLALAEIVKNPQQYGFELPRLSTQPNFATITLHQQIDRAQIANLAGVSTEVVHELNPGMRRFATGPHGTYTIAIPADKLATFKINLARLSDQKRLLWVYHKVGNESLTQLAQRYHTSTALLKNVNHLHVAELAKGAGIIVPVQSNQTYAGFKSAVQPSSTQLQFAQQFTQPNHSNTVINADASALDSSIDSVSANGLLDGSYNHVTEAMNTPVPAAVPLPASTAQKSTATKVAPKASSSALSSGDDLKALMNKLYE